MTPRIARAATAVLAALALLLPGGAAGSAAASATASPAASATASPAVAPAAGDPRTASWCQTLLPPYAGWAALAEQIMRGRVDMGVYGRFTLAANPDWRPQRTLDSSGNQQMQALVWAMPLLYTGVALGKPAMVARFYALLRDWWRDHPYTAPRGPSIDHPIFAGQRTEVLLCAAQVSHARDLRQMAFWEAAHLIARFRLADSNNTAITAQTAALAVSCYVGDRPRKRLAQANLDRLARRLVLGDGSDIEGSPGYARYTHELLGAARAVIVRCGLGTATVSDRMARVETFLAHAVRPDFVLETLGDTPVMELRMRQFPPGSAARFAASQGRDGTPPAETFTTWRGGYLLARNRWRAADDGTLPSFYSVRTSLGPAPTFHTHDDIGAVTFVSRGAAWIGDPGPYRYDASALRSFVRSRAAHSTLTATPLPPLPPPPPAPAPPPVPTPTPTPTGPAPARVSTSASARAAWVPPRPRPGSVVLAAGRDGDLDTTCLRDTTWPTLALVRCVHYSQAADALIVVDRWRAVARTRVVQRWQVPPGVGVRLDAAGATLDAAGQQARLTLAGGGAAAVVGASARGTAGWFTGRYGQRLPGAVVLRQRDVGPGGAGTWVTVVAAGPGAAPAVTVSAAAPGLPVSVSVARDPAAPVVLALPDPPEQP